MDKITNKALAVAVAAMMTVGAAAADDQQQTAPEIKVAADPWQFCVDALNAKNQGLSVGDTLRSQRP